MIAHPEDDLQMATADFCHAALLSEVMFWHTPNGGRRDRREAARLQRMGVLPGVADWTFIWPEQIAGLVFPVIGFIELKSETGRLSAPQKMFAKKCDILGAKWAECRSLEGFVVTLKGWGVPMRGVQVAA